MNEPFLQLVAGKSAEMLELCRRHGFVFETDLLKPTADMTAAERWEKLAFTFYSELVDLSVRAKQILDDEG